MISYHRWFVLPAGGYNRPNFHRWFVTRTGGENHFTNQWFVIRIGSENGGGDYQL
jgi:hypothetical protein